MKWDEENAILSEAYVCSEISHSSGCLMLMWLQIKADQDFIQQTDEAKEKVPGLEKNKEVEMDEL